MITKFFPTNRLSNQENWQFMSKYRMQSRLKENSLADLGRKLCLVWSPRYDIRKMAYLSKTCCTTWLLVLLVAVFQHVSATCYSKDLKGLWASRRHLSVSMSRYVMLLSNTICFSSSRWLSSFIVCVAESQSGGNYMMKDKKKSYHQLPRFP